eukprot:TRINITY_DN6636_c0_g1_i6.p2 TRINITY_DN6636_c0_g1~~TRINITY_DN6636_c0_g1_i6.p2  ORF type:complete len:120 (-),score=1.28 TRINITY_DN6636_c0_g1_i6:107-466(-)
MVGQTMCIEKSVNCIRIEEFKFSRRSQEQFILCIYRVVKQNEGALIVKLDFTIKNSPKIKWLRREVTQQANCEGLSTQVEVYEQSNRPQNSLCFHPSKISMLSIKTIIIYKQSLSLIHI